MKGTTALLESLRRGRFVKRPTMRLYARVGRQADGKLAVGLEDGTLTSGMLCIDDLVADDWQFMPADMARVDRAIAKLQAKRKVITDRVAKRGY